MLCRTSLCVLWIAALCSAQTMTWTELTPKTPPPGRAFHAMAYDSSRDRVVLFGGGILGQELNDTWEFDGADWTQMKPSAPPSKRRDPNMAFDPLRKRVVMQGGLVGSSFLSDTWEWDGTNWSEIKPKTFPRPRANGVMFYDETLKKIVLFGGQISGAVTNETWAWNGLNWAELKPKTSPPARGCTCMGYDAATQRGVLFGGWTRSNNLDDTWEWDGSTWKSVANTSPPSKRHYSACSKFGGSVILFGGATDICCSPTKGDTWQFSSGKWTQLAPKPSPKPRIGHAAVYDSKRGRPVFFGGAPGHNSTPFNDTWIVAGPPRATFDTFGKGCASTTPKFPTVSSAAGPKLGSQFTLDLKGFLPKPRGGYLILGMSDKKWGIIPLPLSLAFIQAPNCSLFVSLDSSNFFVTNSSGAFSAKFTIPSSPTLIGTTFFGQAWAGDPFANQLGLATTNAFKAVVGW